MAKTKKATAKKSEVKETRRILAETAWEVCNQVGGIYTVIRSKVPAMIDKCGDDSRAAVEYSVQENT